MKYQRVSQSGCSCSLASVHYVTGQDTLGRGLASDVDNSCEHSVHSVTCCYAGGKHLSQSWTCWVLDTIKSNSIWQHGQDRLLECTLSRRKFPLGGTANVIGIDKPAATGRPLVYRLNNVGDRTEP